MSDFINDDETREFFNKIGITLLPIRFKKGDAVPEWLLKPDFEVKEFSFLVDVDVYPSDNGGYVCYTTRRLNDNECVTFLDPVNKEIDGSITGAPTHMYTYPFEDLCEGA
jgi:hypothetical protein